MTRHRGGHLCSGGGNAIHQHVRSENVLIEFKCNMWFSTVCGPPYLDTINHMVNRMPAMYVQSILHVLHGIYWELANTY